LVASRSVNGDTVTFSYDDDGLLIRAGELSIERRPDVGLVTGTTLGSVTTTQDYDELGELSGFQASFEGAADLSLAYERDLRGRITRLTESRSGQATDREYRYDDRGRLVEVLEGGARAAAYTWDANGNRITTTLLHWNGGIPMITAADSELEAVLGHTFQDADLLRVALEGRVAASAAGRSKKSAAQRAASLALDKLDLLPGRP
jgi:YD repeat-containing protein